MTEDTAEFYILYSIDQKNEALHAYYQKHSRTYKLKNMHKKSVKPSKFDETQY